MHQNTNSRMKRVLLLLSLLLVTLSSAQTVPYTKFTLSNGMTFILHEDHSAPKVVVNTWFHVGSKDEPEHRSGFAHLFEHLMFMGTKRAPGSAFDKIMEAAGGWNNASTTSDRTNYYDVGTSSLLPTFLWLEADRIEDLGNMMTKEKVDLQRQVVLNERRETENSPYGKAGIKLAELMYPVGHPYHFDTIGLPEDLNAATVQDVKNFFATYYVPNNATMVIAGDFDSAKVKPVIEKLFGTLPRRDDPIHRDAPQPKNDSTTRLTMVDQVQYPQIVLAWHSPANYAPGDAEMDLASYVLSSGISSRLYQKLIYQDKIATDANAAQYSQKLGSQFLVTITAQAGVSLAQLEKEAREVLAEFVQNGPTAEELQRQVAQLETAHLNQLQSIDNIADQMNGYDYYFGEPDSFKRDLDRYRNATPESVKAAAASVLGSEPKVVMTILPAQAKPAKNPRDTQPPIGKDTAWSPTSPTTMTLSNGIKVFYWQRPTLPLMSLTTQIKYGTNVDAPSKAGLADLTTEMLDQGANGLSATQFEQALDQLGASFGASASQEATTVSLASTEGNFGKALALYADALIRPTFDQQEWQRIHQLHLDGLQQALDDPGTVARRVAGLQFFGANNPYGMPVSGTVKTVASITLDDVKAEHANVYQPAFSVIFAAGSMAPDALKAELDKTLGTWTSTSPVPAVANISAPAPKPMRVVLVEKPGAVQTVIRFIMPAPNGRDPRQLKYEAIGTLFGGAFTSRLNANLREAKGYTYGVGAGYNMMPSLGYMVAAADVRTNVTGASLKEFLKEFAKIRTGDITAVEVGKARGLMRTGLIDGATSLAGVTSTAAYMYQLGRPYTDLGKDLQTIAAMTPQQLNALVKGAIPLENAVLVLVGDKAQILAQLKGLGLPTPMVVKAE